jgi:MYXO-CTERM domain-containing protein
MAAVAGVGIANSADAALVYSGIVNIAIPDNIDGVYFNVVTGIGGAVPPAGWDINPYSAGAVGTSFNLWGPTANTWYNPQGVVTGDYTLDLGTLISGPSTAFFRPGGTLDASNDVVLNSDNLFGFRFVNEANANQVHFGWVRINFGANLGSRSIVDYAYDNVAGTGVLAGVVPAPGALALLGLAGLVGTRRRRA